MFVLANEIFGIVWNILLSIPQIFFISNHSKDHNISLPGFWCIAQRKSYTLQQFLELLRAKIFWHVCFRQKKFNLFSKMNRWLDSSQLKLERRFQSMTIVKHAYPQREGQTHSFTEHKNATLFWTNSSNFHKKIFLKRIVKYFAWKFSGKEVLCSSTLEIFQFETHTDKLVHSSFMKKYRWSWCQ